MNGRLTIIKPWYLALLAFMMVTLVLTGNIKRSVILVKGIETAETVKEMKENLSSYMTGKGDIVVKDVEGGKMTLEVRWPTVEMPKSSKETYDKAISKVYQYNNMLLLQKLQKNRNVSEVIFVQTQGKKSNIIAATSFRREEMDMIPFDNLLKKKKIEQQTMYAFASNQYLEPGFYKSIDSDLPKVYSELTLLSSDAFLDIIKDLGITK